MSQGSIGALKIQKINQDYIVCTCPFYQRVNCAWSRCKSAMAERSCPGINSTTRVGLTRPLKRNALFASPTLPATKTYCCVVGVRCKDGTYGINCFLPPPPSFRQRAPPGSLQWQHHCLTTNARGPLPPPPPFTSQVTAVRLSLSQQKIYLNLGSKSSLTPNS